MFRWFLPGFSWLRVTKSVGRRMVSRNWGRPTRNQRSLVFYEELSKTCEFTIFQNFWLKIFNDETWCCKWRFKISHRLKFPDQVKILWFNTKNIKSQDFDYE